MYRGLPKFDCRCGGSPTAWKAGRRRDTRAEGRIRIIEPERAENTERAGPRTVFAIIGVLLIPACITLASVRHPAGRGPGAGEASPLGYTWSLSFALVPVVAILVAARARRRSGNHW